MTDKTCSIEGCEKPAQARGWCAMHYQRWRKNGDPGTAAGRNRQPSPELAFAAKTLRQGDCLVWTGTVSHSEVRPDHPMGVIRVDGALRKVHRYAWEREHGPIPDGMEINHRCWNTLCCDTDHLELVSRADNNRYRNGARRDSGTGVRNVQRRNGHWVVSVEHLGARYGGRHDTLEAAELEADMLRKELFGDYAGRGVAA